MIYGSCCITVGVDFIFSPPGYCKIVQIQNFQIGHQKVFGLIVRLLEQPFSPQAKCSLALIEIFCYIHFTRLKIPRRIPHPYPNFSFRKRWNSVISKSFYMNKIIRLNIHLSMSIIIKTYYLSSNKCTRHWILFQIFLGRWYVLNIDNL